MRLGLAVGMFVAAALAVIVAACGGPASSPTGTIAAPAASASPAPTAPTATAAPIATSAPTTAATPFPTPTPEPPPIAITEVECLSGQTVRLHVSITDERGIVSYQLWSTWGGGGDTTRSFPTPYQDHIDESVQFTHAIVDPEPRIHQFGLAVTLAGVAEPIIVYAIEPENRCPGH
jgi:hypothetical protein